MYLYQPSLTKYFAEPPFAAVVAYTLLEYGSINFGHVEDEISAHSVKTLQARSDCVDRTWNHP